MSPDVWPMPAEVPPPKYDVKFGSCSRVGAAHLALSLLDFVRGSADKQLVLLDDVHTKQPTCD